MGERVIGLVAMPSSSSTTTTNTSTSTTFQEGEEEENLEEDEEATTLLETRGTFSHVQIWEHERVPGADDVFSRGLDEWIRFAETVSGILFVFRG